MSNPAPAYTPTPDVALSRPPAYTSSCTCTHHCTLHTPTPFDAPPTDTSPDYITFHLHNLGYLPIAGHSAALSKRDALIAEIIPLASSDPEFRQKLEGLRKLQDVVQGYDDLEEALMREGERQLGKCQRAGKWRMRRLRVGVVLGGIVSAPITAAVGAIAYPVGMGIALMADAEMLDDPFRFCQFLEKHLRTTEYLNIDSIKAIRQAWRREIEEDEDRQAKMGEKAHKPIRAGSLRRLKVAAVLGVVIGSPVLAVQGAMMGPFAAMSAADWYLVNRSKANKEKQGEGCYCARRHCPFNNY